MQSEKEHLVLVRCSDGRIKVPDAFCDYIVHPIGMPGGPIAPELSSITNDGGDKTLEVLNWSIDVMVTVKKPTRIVLVAHSHCAAAGLVGYNEIELEEACMKFGLALGKRYPHIRVTVFFDRHTECGQHREPPQFKDTVLDEAEVLA